MGTRLGLVTLAGVMACANPRPVQAPAPTPPLVVKTYAPLGMRDDAKAPNHAVILGTDAKDGSTLVPLPAATSTTTVDLAGRRTSVTLSTGPNPDHGVHVGIVDGSSAGTGPQGRASVWSAAVVAATVLDKDLTDVTFSATPTGPIDDVSASALMAAGFIASITGATLDPTATLTGALLPDGTLGPVDDIPQTFLVAIEHGKRRLGYPRGMRRATSRKTGELVDLEKLAADHGAKAVEIADVYDAYALLTGTTLPRPVPVTAEDMALDAETVTAISAKYKTWQQHLATEWGSILQLESAGRLPPLLAFLRDTSKANGEQAAELYRRGQVGAAYARIVTATLYAQTANQTYAALAAVQDGKIDDAIAMLARTETLAADTRASLAKIGTVRPSTMGGHLQNVAAFRAASRASAFASIATRSAELAKPTLAGLAGKTTAQLGSDAVAQTVVQAIVPTLLYASKTTSELMRANDELDVPAGADVNYTSSLPNVERLATAFRAAAAASLPYVESRLGSDAPDSLLAARLDAGELHDASGLLMLASSALAYDDVAQRIATYDSLGPRVRDDGSGRVDALAHDGALSALLATAERTARATARTARVATGAIPVQAKLAYQAAVADAQSDSLTDKLSALEQFWAASAYAQTAVMLALNS